ncbi:putative polypeptide N-acetylgalactosaminyltransferase 10 [Anopheles aquasalis]|uniref:putative polypeptide N-acetylgalactosaminyltransferase 10 n=1 Tax=Anopheles aquasalis TaxID=42839 RepID=UPI00215A12AB|nr:putative polypeptide N-acetylgalactosaminyltransferase 10 [Anopheles aquasalis]
MIDDKLDKARKARLRSRALGVLSLLYTLRYLLVIACTTAVVLYLRERRLQHGNIVDSVPDAPVKELISTEKIDYNDYQQLALDRKRVGPGEQGKAATLSPAESESEQRKKLYHQNGFNALLSDKISVNRSIADLRHPSCKLQQYLKQLPTASVVVPFYEEHWTTLLRTVYSVLNRSPPHLLKEVIIVDDGSTKEFLHGQLQDYIDQNLPKVKLIRQGERTGLMKARLAGAQLASGDVLVFLDSHTEAGYNWLPPLLEPIAENPKTCVCPLIDIIDDQTFNVHAQDEGGRGLFDWRFHYKRIALKDTDRVSPTAPFPSPVMAGGLFAIGANFFWELGGYDEELDIWGAEQYELSFKIWQCGGRMLDAPCSRFGHIYRSYSPFPNTRKYDFITRNHKRVAEIWMDEYKQYIYDRDPMRYARSDAGDMSKMRAIREKLQCKPFAWFLKEVAPEILQLYPPVEPEPFASGAIQSIADPALCLDTMQRGRGKPIGMYPCDADLIQPKNMNQYFVLSWHRDIQLKSDEQCFDVPESAARSPITLYTCHNIKYLRQLPSTSVIVPFYDEHWSTLLRTVYSVVRRSPSTVLLEIILVDDGSLKMFLKQQLDNYVATHLKQLVKIVHLPTRSGLITARLAGAKIAKGDVLVFLDSHVEAGINWLPPLLEPIANNPRTCVCPFIDVIMDETFELIPQDQGARGAFDWNMLYKRLPLRPEDQTDPTQPFESPVMAGGLFAISSSFFWELGGYDEMLEIWGAEQYELSFKIWQCGGRMIDVPCSRVGHIYRSYSPFPNVKTYDFVAKNHKRVAEVWMDEYKQYVYKKDPLRFSIDAGDLTKMKELRRRLNCKPFRWFMEHVAPDLVDWYPPIEPEPFAFGVIQSQANTGLCVEAIDVDGKKGTALMACAKDKVNPERFEQHFQFTWRREVKSMVWSQCLDVSDHTVRVEIPLFPCHTLQGNQLFQYDVDTKQIYIGRDKKYCVEADLANRRVMVNICSHETLAQQWRIGQMNVEHLRNWNKHGAKFVN